MTNHLQEPPLAPRDVTSSGPEVAAVRSVRQGSLIAGTGILLMAVLAGVGQLVVIEGLITEGNAAKTAEDILASEGMFRLGVASWYVVAILDVVVDRHGLHLQLLGEGADGQPTDAAGVSHRDRRGEHPLTAERGALLGAAMCSLRHLTPGVCGVFVLSKVA